MEEMMPLLRRRDLALLPALGISGSLQKDLAAWMAYAAVPACAGAIVRRDGRREEFAVGADVETTLFSAASLTKQVTAYLVGVLGLDLKQPLSRWLPELSEGRARRVTIGQALSHCGGFPNWRFEAGQALTCAFEPGERFRYSGEGYVCLQRIVEAETGRSFAEAVREKVFEPLGMASSSLFWRPEWEGRYAVPHRGNAEPDRNWTAAAKRLQVRAKAQGKSAEAMRYEECLAAAERPLPNWMLPNAAASLLTTVRDYAKFVTAAVLRDGTGKRLLEDRRVEVRHGAGWYLGWGPGWGIEQTASGRRFLWQWGDNGGSKAIVLAEPARGEALFAFTNGEKGKAVYERLAARLHGFEHPALLWI
jgi:CubicO group peptidase (beta-lactamase class C family)